jgi:fucose 4-O-acetylase-like acetyltransferase
MTTRDHTGDGQPVSGDRGDSRDATAPGPRSEPAPPPDDLALGRGGRASRPETKRRNEALDIVKAVLIMMVVFAHLVEHFSAHDPYYRAWYSALSSFGLPLFILVSGMLAGPLLSDLDYRKLFSRLLLPLICLQPFYLALLQRIQGGAVHHLLDPQWMLWFLLSLCCWRLMLPLFLRIPAALPVSVGITLAAGYATDIGPDLSLSRTLYFFPFFLAGYLYRQRVLDLVARARLLWGVLFVALMVGVVVWSLHGLPQALFYGSEGYDLTAVWSAYPALGRLVLLLVATLGLLSFMAIMPRRSRWLARIGRRTLTIFVLHGFPVLVCYKLFNIVGWSTPSPALTPVFVVLAVGIAWVLSWLDGPFNRFFDWLAARLSRRT